MYIYILIYFIALVFVVLAAARAKSVEDFLVAGRSTSVYKLMTSKFAGAVGVATFITYTGYAYDFGLGIFSLLFGSVIGYTIFAFWAAPKINALSSIYQFTTQGDLTFQATQSDIAKKVTNWVTVVIQFFWVLLSLVGGAKIMAQFGVITYPWALLITSSVVLIYLLISGLKAVIITDVIQAIVIIVFLFLIVNNLMSTPTSLYVLGTLEVKSIKSGQIIGLLLYGGLSVYGMADRYQLCFAAKDPKTARKGMGLAILPVLIVAFLLMLIGLNALRVTSGLDSDLVFLHAMTNQLSSTWQPLLITLFFAGLMSSADTSAFAVSSHVVANTNSKDKVRSIRIATTLLIITSVIIALFWKNIVEITIVGAALRLVLSVPMIYILLNKQNPGRFLASVFGGCLGLAGGLIAFGADPKLAITTLLGTLLGLIYKSKNNQLS